MVNSEEFEKQILNYGWKQIPKEIITREGLTVNVSSEKWDLPYTLRSDPSLKFDKIKDPRIRWSFKQHIIDRLQHVSSHAGYAAFQDVWREFLRFLNIDSISVDDLCKNLIAVVEKAISNARKEHRLWALYRPIQWYIWCAENYPEVGFSPAYAMELEGMIIPGNPKAEAVKTEDPNSGPLHRTLELPLLIKALRDDKSTNLKNLQEKAALALSIAFGRNPANLTYLLEEDFDDLTPEEEVRCYVIRMPRIKKRQLTPRDDFLEEYLENELAGHLIALIEKNKQIDTTIKVNNKKITIPKPLFIKKTMNQGAINAGLWENSFNMLSNDITSLFKKFVKRHNIISPITHKLLQINTRRLRYTLATNLAAEGISKKELARILDHSDTQHVEVYFQMAGRIVEHLDKAAAKSFSRYLSLFKGRVIENDSEAVNGNRNDKHLFYVNETEPTDQTDIGVCGKKKICHLDPPFSCYLCIKFQPYRHADHEYVLDCLLMNREQKLKIYENSRLGIQLDHVIFAVAQVVESCLLENENV